MERLKCGTIIEYPYDMFQSSKWKIIREFGGGYQILADLICIECPDKRGLGATKTIPLRHLSAQY